MSHARLFRRAEVIVEAQIQRVVESTDGDAARALRALVEWANAGGRKRRTTLIRATRHRVGCPPSVAVLVDQVIAELGLDRENPARRLVIEQELAAAAAAAIHAWVKRECQAWREQHGR